MKLKVGKLYQIRNYKSNTIPDNAAGITVAFDGCTYLGIDGNSPHRIIHLFGYTWEEGGRTCFRTEEVPNAEISKWQIDEAEEMTKVKKPEQYVKLPLMYKTLLLDKYEKKIRDAAKTNPDLRSICTRGCADLLEEVKEAIEGDLETEVRYTLEAKVKDLYNPEEEE